jgi:hypothetical protein
MKYLFALTLFFTNILFSQITESKNYYSFSIVNGINKTSSKLVLGDRTPEDVYGISHGFNFHYTRLLSSKFSLSAGVGLGFLPLKIKVSNLTNSQGIENLEYTSRFSYKVFTKYELLGSYHKVLNDKFSLKFNFGAGINHFGNSSHGYSSTYDNMNLNFIFNSTSSPRPYLILGSEIAKTLKNKDLLSLKLNFDYSFKNVFAGTYSLNNGTSKGEYFNRGNFLNLALAYTITGNNRLNKIEKAKEQFSVDKKGAKRLVRKANRFIDPKSTFLNFSGGLGVGMNLVESDPGSTLMKGGFAAFLPRISVEKGLKKNFYAEIGFHSQRFWDVTKFDINYSGSFGSDAFYAYQLSFGGAYRWILKNNYNVLNIHSGFTVGYQNEKNLDNGPSSWGGGSLALGTFGNEVYLIQYDSQTRIKSNVLASYYLGLSKDFRIVNNFYLSLSYRQQFGLIKASETTYNYSGLNVPTTEGAKTKINGTSRDFQLGFKIKL